ncbi:MAG: MBL fold metallo-hydrolase, partial [Actinobacteria bacterium]|nr:MBL fold metallo-hydrolase [Actinomycetota bacterium]
MIDVLDIAERLYTGELERSPLNPFSDAGDLAEIAPGVVFVVAFSNVAGFDTEAGLLLVDTSSWFHARTVKDSLRAWTPSRLDTAVFTHGHTDHCMGMELYEEEARSAGWVLPRVVAHDAIAARFDRYQETWGYNAIINQRQFHLPELSFPKQFRYPDDTFRTELDLAVGDARFELHHDRGETDDHTWVWEPERKILCAGDMFIWASPNCGNPQKAQRYAIEWARGMRKMIALGPEIMLPGHGLPIVGADRVRTALDDSATLLEHLHTETIKLMNEGARLDDIVNTVKAPERLLEKPYLRPVYDEPEFVVRGIWRLFGGWWDGDPSRLKPAPAASLAAELATLAGGADVLARR